MSNKCRDRNVKRMRTIRRKARRPMRPILRMMTMMTKNSIMINAKVSPPTVIILEGHYLIMTISMKVSHHLLHPRRPHARIALPLLRRRRNCTILRNFRRQGNGRPWLRWPRRRNRLRHHHRWQTLEKRSMKSTGKSPISMPHRNPKTINKDCPTKTIKRHAQQSMNEIGKASRRRKSESFQQQIRALLQNFARILSRKQSKLSSLSSMSSSSSTTSNSSSTHTTTKITVDGVSVRIKEFIQDEHPTNDPLRTLSSSPRHRMDSQSDK